jgi:hypothetical protein
MTKGELQVRSKRSGFVPGAITAVAGGVFLGFDENHLHVIHHMFGRYSEWVALAVLVLFITFTTRLMRRPAGHVEISSGKE